MGDRDRSSDWWRDSDSAFGDSAFGDAIISSLRQSENLPF
jgi:hypothetical protein